MGRLFHRWSKSAHGDSSELSSLQLLRNPEQNSGMCRVSRRSNLNIFSQSPTIFSSNTFCLKAFSCLMWTGNEPSCFFLGWWFLSLKLTREKTVRAHKTFHLTNVRTCKNHSLFIHEPHLGRELGRGERSIYLTLVLFFITTSLTLGEKVIKVINSHSKGQKNLQAHVDFSRPVALPVKPGLPGSTSWYGEVSLNFRSGATRCDFTSKVFSWRAIKWSNSVFVSSTKLRFGIKSPTQTRFRVDRGDQSK